MDRDHLLGGRAGAPEAPAIIHEDAASVTRGGVRVLNRAEST